MRRTLAVRAHDILRSIPGIGEVAVAARFNPDMTRKYKALTCAGKPAKLALAAIMRKFIELANTLAE